MELNIEPVSQRLSKRPLAWYEAINMPCKIAGRIGDQIPKACLSRVNKVRRTSRQRFIFDSRKALRSTGLFRSSTEDVKPADGDISTLDADKVAARLHRLGLQLWSCFTAPAALYSLRGRRARSLRYLRGSVPALDGMPNDFILEFWGSAWTTHGTSCQACIVNRRYLPGPGESQCMPVGHDPGVMAVT